MVNEKINEMLRIGKSVKIWLKSTPSIKYDCSIQEVSDKFILIHDFHDQKARIILIDSILSIEPLNKSLTANQWGGSYE